MKFKGKVLIEKWNNANAVVSRINRPGEIGGVVRNSGYDVQSDGFSCCDFTVKGTWLRFYANCYDGKWKLGKCMGIAEGTISLEGIEPDKEYDIKERTSVAEKFEQGMFNGGRFAVCNTSKVIGYFDSFESADNYARKTCKEYIDSRWKDRDCTRYYETAVVNDKQRASERGEIRHYPWYCYQGHEHFISVYPTK